MRTNIILLLVFISVSLFPPDPAYSQASSGVDAAWRGDMNENGEIDIFDLLGLMRHLVSGNFVSDKKQQIANVDRSADGKITVFDLIALLKILSGREEPRPVIFSCGVNHVWAVGDGEKVFRDDLVHPCMNSNSIWDGDTIRFKGLYNEVLAFQVIVIAGNYGALSVEVSADFLVHTESGEVIASAQNPPYSHGGWFEIFSQHYIHVENPTNPNWFYGSSASAPARMTGWIPDALITPDAEPDKGGFPIHIPSSKVQGFWVDLFLPRDTIAFSPGVYTGKLRVLEEGWEVAALPVKLELLPLYLPDENHSNVWLFNSGVKLYFPELDSTQIDTMLKHMAHRHRIDLVGGFQPHRSQFDQGMMDAYKPYLDGNAFTSQAGYKGPGQGEPEHLFPIGMYGSAVLGDTKEQVQEQSDLWVDWFEANAPQVRYFWYLIDEPGTDKFNWVAERAGWIHDNPGSGKRLPVFTTRAWTAELDNAIDLWAGGRGMDLQKLAELKEQGEDHWFYNGSRPRYGSVILEAEAVDFRMNAWAKYIYQVNTWFLWHGNHWRHNSQGPRAHEHQNVFTDPVTFISGPNTFGNGDGIVLYPGNEPFYSDESRGLNKIFGSIRLKNIRRGQQDYEIMWLAEQKAGREQVLEIVKKVVPRAFSEVDMDEAVPWSQRGDDYDAARLELLELISEQ